MSNVSISFRLHKWSCTDKLIKFIHQYHKWFVVIETEANREHIQGYVEVLNKKNVLPKTIVDKFRKDIKKSQDLNGNSDFSVKMNDGAIENIIYLCKGKGKETLPNILINNKVLENDIRLYRDKYWEKNEELKATDGKKKWYKIRDEKLSEKLQKKFQDNPQVIWTLKIIQYHNNNDLLIPDNYSIKKMVRTYILKDLDEVKREQMMVNIALEIFGDY